jgi:hypothetical protein
MSLRGLVLERNILGLDVVAEACNPSYFLGGDKESFILRQA